MNKLGVALAAFHGPSTAAFSQLRENEWYTHFRRRLDLLNKKLFSFFFCFFIRSMVTHWVCED